MTYALNESNVKPPSLINVLLEGRVAAEFGAYVAAMPVLLKAPRGDGHPVLVLPGFMADDHSTRPLRAFLNFKGYDARGWELGRNMGKEAINSVQGLSFRLMDRVKELADYHGRKVSLVGWSLGGIYARELARVMPDEVRLVVSLGSPFAYTHLATNVTKVYELFNGDVADLNLTLRQRLEMPPPVPSTAIFSRTDGVASWHSCYDRQNTLDEITENVEVEGSHIGLGHNPLAVWVIADRLAQAEGKWEKFDRSGLKGLLYRDPKRKGYLF